MAEVTVEHGVDDKKDEEVAVLILEDLFDEVEAEREEEEVVRHLEEGEVIQRLEDVEVTRHLLRKMVKLVQLTVTPAIVAITVMTQI